MLLLKNFNVTREIQSKDFFSSAKSKKLMKKSFEEEKTFNMKYIKLLLMILAQTQKALYPPL